MIQYWLMRLQHGSMLVFGITSELHGNFFLSMPSASQAGIICTRMETGEL